VAIYRVLQEEVLTERDFYQQIDALPKEPARGLEAASAQPIEFLPVGKGKPLTVMIRHVYTGRHPERSFFLDKGGDIAVVSGVKDFDVFSASARALNFVATGQRAHSHLRGPAALEQGTAVVTYSPALLADSITLTIEIAVARFPAELVASLSGAFTALSGLPLLMPYAGYLLGAGQLVKLSGDLGHSLFDGPVFSITDPLNFEVPGSAPAQADFRVLANSTLRANRYNFKDGQGLIDARGAPYDGDEPYVVVSLDGRANSRLEKFAPTVASSAVLQRFFQIKDGQQALIDTFVEGIRLASDMKYRDRAKDLQADIARLQGEPDRKAALEKELDSVRKNITTKDLQV
jgi:hypothetical protein